MNKLYSVLHIIWQKTFKYHRMRYINWYYSHISEKRYPKILERNYRKRLGKPMNWENPQTYNEKSYWTRLNDRNPRKTELADKYAVRKWVAETIGEEYLIPLLGVWDNAGEIDFDALPEKFVLKTNHGSHWNIIVKDKKTLNIKDTRKQLNWWLKLNIAYQHNLELHYAGIKPRIIAEKYMEDSSCGELPDYKFFCYSGKVHYCAFDVNRFSGHKRNFYDTQWNLLPVQEDDLPNTDKAIDKPLHFDEMVKIASKLSEGFAFVRVDLYYADGKIYFGEMTFTPDGWAIRYIPPEYDEIFGEPWVIEKV